MRTQKSFQLSLSLSLTHFSCASLGLHSRLIASINDMKEVVLEAEANQRLKVREQFRYSGVD